jgi:hypothetical protein
MPWPRESTCFTMAWELANRENRPVVDKNKTWHPCTYRKQRLILMGKIKRALVIQMFFSIHTSFEFNNAILYFFLK